MQDGSAAPDSGLEGTRIRLITGMLEAIEEKGLASTTVADIVRLARVSKRTFYEHFESKEQCFLAAYEAVSAETQNVIASAADASSSWDERVLACVRAYLELLEAKRALTRTFLLEIHAAGTEGLRARRDVHARFAELLRGLVAKARKEQPELRPLSPKMATAVVGGINELVLVALERDGERLGDLAGTAAELVRAVVTPR